jgi:hypothetical protein
MPTTVPVVPAEEVGSFCAFLYGIRFKPDVRAAFKADYATSQAVMDAYELTPDERKYVNELHEPDYYSSPTLTAAQRASKWASLVALLLPEFYEWTYRPDPYWW